MQEMQEARVQSLGQKDPPELELATHSSILAWKIRWTEQPDRLQSMGSKRVRHSQVIEHACTTTTGFTVIGNDQFSRSVMSNSVNPWTEACQASLSITNSWSLLKLLSIESVMPSNHIILHHPLFLSPSIPFPASKSFQMSQFFKSGGQSIAISATASVLPMNIQDDLLEDGLVVFPCISRDSQRSSPTPQFKSINSSVLSSLYSPTLTSMHDDWKIHSFDYTDLCWQSYVSAF